MINGGPANGVSGGTLSGNGRTHVLDDAPDAVRVARRFVHACAEELGAGLVADDAALVAAELLANATQHGAAPVIVTVSGGGGSLRIEVRDAGPRLPLRPAPSTSNMTGRGLTLVGALTVGWGVDRHDAGGKTVWAELRPPTDGDDISDGLDDLDAMLAQWDDLADAPAERYAVALGDVPTDLLIEAKAHIDNLVREFSLAAAAADEAEEVPPHLAALVDTVVNGFADARAAIKRQALAAASRGEARTLLTLNLPLSAADAGVAYLAALDEADEYARAARLLTLETPPEHRVFRHWYVEAVIEQLRTVAAGEAPAPVVSFERHLLAAVRRLSAAQRATERTARLQRVTAALARARTPEDVAAAVVSDAVVTLGASGGALLVPAADGEHLAVPGTVGYAEHLVGQLRDERLDAELPAATALRTGQSVWIESQEERDEMFPQVRGFEGSTVAMCAVPLVVGDRTIGVLRFSFTARKLFDEDERAFVQALAAQTASTLLRTEIYAAEREAALEIQRALLPDVDLEVPGWEFAAYYSPAQDDEAGGDFYDVLPLPDGRIVAFIGDVMGRGVHAAAAMAQIRSTIRAYALDDADPSCVFRRVDAFFEQLGLVQLVTVLYVLVEVGGDHARIFNAGHLPPVIVDGRGSRLLPAAAGLPFGVQSDERPVTDVRLEAGAALVLLTDGVVERRHSDLDAGVERVVSAVAEGGPSARARGLVHRVVAATDDDGARDDDVTVLVLRRR